MLMIASDFVFVCVPAENRVFERLVLVGVDETQDDGFSVFFNYAASRATI